MKHNALPRVRSLIAMLVIIACALPGYAASVAAAKIIVFGDSLNDQGNMVQFTNGAFPNAPYYYYGRQSNGPVWVEYLATQLGMADKVASYAVVGALTKATAEFPTGNVWSDEIPGLEGTDVATHVSDYLADAKGIADPTALYILEGGANDFPRVANPAVIVANLVECFLRLQAHGAKHVVIVNLPDLGKTPRLIIAEQLGLVSPGTAAYVSYVCDQLNQALAGAVQLATAPGVTATFADMYGFLNSVTADPASYGFVEVQQPYLLSDHTADPATWLFWDDVHPTTRGHELFANSALASLAQTYTPTTGRQPPVALRGFVKIPQR